MRIKAVIFDLGGTLTKYWLVEETLHKVLLTLGINRTVEEIKEAMVKTKVDFKTRGYDLMCGKLSYQKYWNLWRSFVLKHLVLAENKKLLAEMERRWRQHIECEIEPDVDETLTKLKKHRLKMAIISTAYEEDVLAILEKAGIQKDLFEVIAGADATSERKPHPRAFTYVLKKLHLNPEETLFVGDSVEEDYNAAERTGIKAILIDRTGSKGSKTSGLRTITNLEDVFLHIM